MKHLRLTALLVASALLLACETNEQAGGAGRAEKREMARRQAAQQRQAESAQDESQQNLWRAQQTMLNRDSNPMRP